MSAEWWRSYRAKNKDRLSRQQSVRRRLHGRGDRSAERARENQQRRQRRRMAYVPDEPLPMLMPCLQHGTAISFWEDELRLDLAQEAELAKIEGRCPIAAVKEYRARERSWHLMTAFELFETNGDGSAP